MGLVCLGLLESNHVINYLVKMQRAGGGRGQEVRVRTRSTETTMSILHFGSPQGKIHTDHSKTSIPGESCHHFPQA